jgi:hypothetical protein
MTEGTTETISPRNYKHLFQGKEGAALAHALDIRKFEIDLYWKRATYFWTFIGATFAGFLAVQSSTVSNKEDLSVLLSCLGLVFSFAWFCVNRGSKYWQENWEKHVDMLEDSEIGPLYKVVLSRNTEDYNWRQIGKDWVSGPRPLSVSKINQIISLYVFVLWVGLLIYSLPIFHVEAHQSWFYFALIGTSILACALFITLGRTYGGGYYHIATLRKSRIKPTKRLGKK